MHHRHETRRSFQLSVNERPVDDKLGRYVRDLSFLPLLHLPLHGIEVPLHAVDSNTEAVLQRKVLRVLRQHGREDACTRSMRTDSCSLEVIPSPSTVVFGSRKMEATFRLRISHGRGLDQPAGLPEQRALEEVEKELKPGFCAPMTNQP
jgi:hypothetical protein